MGREVVKTRLKRGAKVFAKILTSGKKPNGRVLQAETLRLLQVKLGDEFILVDEPNGEVSLVGTVEVGKIQDPGQILVRSDSPVGEGKIFLSGAGTSGPITCEWCGTEWNEDADPEEGGDVSVGFNVFNGVQVVRECCGRIFDILFEELGRTFFFEYLNQVIDRPFENKYETKRIFDAAKKIRDKADALRSEADEALDGVEFGPKKRPF